MKNKTKLNFSLNSLSETSNPSQMEATFIVHDFEKSWNNGVITKEVCEENMSYLVGQYICCKYISKEENDGLDALSDHCQTSEINRDTGKEMMATGTTPIGHITEVFIQEQENGQEALYCKAILWLDKFYNCLSFLNEMLEAGISIPCSVEYSYKNYTLKDEVIYVQSPVYYSALCILNPIDRNKIKKVLPAYDCSMMVGYNSLNEAIDADLKLQDSANDKKVKGESESEKMENIFIKALNSISLGDIRDAIFKQLSETMVANEFNSMWLSNYDIFDDYFVYESYLDGDWKTYKVNYTKSEDGITVDYSSKVEVSFKRVMVEKETMEAMESSMNELQDKVATLEAEKEETTESLNSANEKITELEAEVSALKDDKITLAEEVKSLNNKVEELSPYKEEADKEAYEKSLNEKQEYYKAKFTAVGGEEVYASEEVQGLIKETLDLEKSANAIEKLKDLVIEMIAMPKSLNEKEKETTIKESCSKKLENLIPTEKSTVEFYGFEI